MAKRHQWGEKLINPFTEQQQCIGCGIYRIKVFQGWMYAREQTTKANPFVGTIPNPGCQEQATVYIPPAISYPGEELDECNYHPI
jgi:hypothetical protein